MDWIAKGGAVVGTVGGLCLVAYPEPTSTVAGLGVLFGGGLTLGTTEVSRKTLERWTFDDYQAATEQAVLNRLKAGEDCLKAHGAEN